MKKGIILVFILSISIHLSAQKIHFTDTSNVWEQFADCYNDGLPPLLYYWTYNYIHDTTFSSVNYKVFSFGAVREDTLLKKVYIRDMTNDSDITLMDYNLNVGDTFTTVFHPGPNYYTRFRVLSIDSTLINATWHKVWHFSEPIGPLFNWPCEVIEGIGCVQHPTYMLMESGIEPPDYKMYCFSNNSITPPLTPAVSHLNNSTSCTLYPTLNISSRKSHVNIQLSPNPATTQLTITAPIKITQAAITNLLGQTIYTHEYNTEKVEINVADLPTGLYFVRVNNAEVRKFVKE